MMEEYNYTTLTIDLTAAHYDTPHFTGLKNCLLVRTIDDLNSGLNIKFDRTDNERITLSPGDLFMFRKIETGEPVSFKKVFITNVAVAQGTAELVFTQNIEFARRLRFTSDIISAQILQQVITVGVVPTLIPAAPLVDRINILLYNNGANTIYIGSATVTVAGATQGIPLLVGAAMPFTITPGVDLYGIVVAATEPLNILEGA